MRYHEIFEVRGTSAQARAAIRRIDIEMSELDRSNLAHVMYGHGALAGELEAEKLEASRLANARARVEIERIRVEIERERGRTLDDALLSAKIAKTRAETRELGDG